MSKKTLTGFRNYILIVLSVIIISVLFIMLLSMAGVKITNNANEKYLPYYKAGEKGVSSPWYNNGLHIVDEGIINQLSDMKQNDKNIVSIGSSLSIISFQPWEEKLPEGYRYHFLVCGNGSWKSDKILYNLANEDEVLNPDDIIKLEVSFSTFRDPGLTIVETTLNKWKKFSADEDGNVTKKTKILTPIYKLNERLLIIQNVWELAADAISQKLSGENFIIPGNFRNNYFAYDAVAANCVMTEEMRDEMDSLIDRINGEHRLVVEISPIPKGLCDTQYGKELTEYIDDELIPRLEDKGINYLDYRYDYSDDEFADGVHLGYDAGVRYTRNLNEDLGKIIEENK